MIHIEKINQVPSPYSKLQDIGRVATPKLLPRNCLTYLQTTLKVAQVDPMKIKHIEISDFV